MDHDAVATPVAPPPSRLLQALIHEATTTRDPRTWARSVCLAAAHQARTGLLDEAPASLARVRAAYGPGIDPEVACWLILSEGILLWCRLDTGHGYTRVRSAHALAMAMGADAAPSCAAWMAQLEFHAGRYDRMIERLTEVFEHGRPDDHLARAQAALVIATSHHMAGSDADARRWYQKCRNLCSRVGDEATTGAIFHNMASRHLALLRLQDAFGPIDPKAVDQVRQEVSNTVTFDLLTHNDTLRVKRELVQARMALLVQDYPQARQHFRIALESGKAAPDATACAIVDAAWCDARLDPEHAPAIWASLRDRAATFPEHLEPDDRACVEMRMAALADLAGARDAREVHLSRALEARTAHARACAQMRERMAVFG